MAKKRILILGAGLAGLSAAWHLQKSKIECIVFEKETQVGGLCRSKNLKGFIFDYSGHLLHFRHHYTFDFLKKLLGYNLQEHKRSAWIYSHNTFTPYPFQANFYGLPASIVKECLLGFLETFKEKPATKINQLTFLEWIHQTFGAGIARHFMVPYNTKFWTMSPRQLTCEWLEGFIPTPSFEEVIEGALEDSGKLLGYNSHFWYPRKGGIGSLCETLASQLKNICTSNEIREIDIERKEIIVASGRREKFDCVVSTIPLPEMAHLVTKIPGEINSAFRQLKWNSIFNLNLGLEKLNVNGKHWVYFPEKTHCFFRVGFFHNFSSMNAPRGKVSLYTEVSYSKDKPIDKAGIVKKITHDLNKTGILDKKDKICCSDINDIKYGYPIYDKNYVSARNKIRNYLLGRNVYLVGRYGSWRYMSMEDVLLDGKHAASYVTDHA